MGIRLRYCAFVAFLEPIPGIGSRNTTNAQYLEGLGVVEPKTPQKLNGSVITAMSGRAVPGKGSALRAVAGVVVGCACLILLAVLQF